MPSSPDARRRSWGDVKGALNGAASAFAIAIASGTLVFAPLGAEGLAAGVAASLAAASAGGLVAALLSSTPVSISAPRAAVSIVIAGLVAALHRLLPEAPASTIIALVSVAVAAAGVVQIAAAAARLGRVVRFVPFPVIAGFTHGVALTLVLVYAPLFLGLSDVPRIGLPRIDAVHWAAPAIGVLALAATWGFSRRGARWPALFLGMVVGVAAHLAASQWFPGADLGRSVAAGGFGTPAIAAWHAAGLGEVLRDAAVWRLLVSFAVAIAAVASIDSLMGAVANDTRFGTRSRPDRDLAAQGTANLLSGALGGVAVAYSLVNVQAAYAAGARGRLSGPLAALLVGVVAAALAAWRPELPLVVLAALMLFVAVRLADPWGFVLVRRVVRGRGLASPLVRESFLVYLLVAASILVLDVISAVLIGFVVATILFVRTLNRHLVRGVTAGGAIRSRRLYPPHVMRLLVDRMRAVAVVELEGPLFFGTADRVVEEVDRLPSGLRFVVVDLRRVHALDATAGAVLARMNARLARQARTLLICGGPPGLGEIGDPLPPSFRDRDRAIEWIEARLIEEGDGRIVPEPLEPAAFAAALGLRDSEADAFAAHTEVRAFRAGEPVFRDGDPSDELCFLLSGRISIMHGPSPEEALRVVTFLPGNLFGDVAFLDGLPRTATAHCDEDSRVALLRRPALEALGRAQPGVVTRVYVSLAVDIAGRLRATDRLVRETA